MAKYFGTDGIRGRFGIELNAPLAFKVAQSLKSVLNVDKLVIGIDTRESSTELMYACASGAQSIGVDVMLAGVVSTPLISHYSKEKQIAGIGFNSTVKDELIVKVSGSHKRVLKIKFK